MAMLRRSDAKQTIAVEPTDWSKRADFETASVLEAELNARLQGEVRFDRISRMLYATDASNYQVDPVGVVIPRSQDDVIGAMNLAASHGVPILPRGGGSGLAGQSVGAALIMDTSKYLNRVISINEEERQVTVEAGMVLDQFNRQLKSTGLMFGPDPSSANRATIGGVVGNNAAGAHSILYGMTASNIAGARVQLPNGDTADLTSGTMEEHIERAKVDDGTGRLLKKLLDFRTENLELIERTFPPHWRRATGYSLNEFAVADDAFNPARLLASSEGTLGTLLAVTLELVPTPTRTALVLLQFDDLVKAMEATNAILEVNPSAIELMDRMLINLTRNQPGYASQIEFIHGDPAGLLAVEFYGENDAELLAKCNACVNHLTKHGIGLMVDAQVLLDPKQQAKVWNVRKAGLGLLMSVRGDAKPIPVIEDVSVPVEHLPEYVATVQRMVERHGTTAAFYAHASSGCLHVRPLINLKTLEGVEAMREMAHEAAELAARFGGYMSGEHGDGLQRSELNEKIFGTELYEKMREFKAIFDPEGLMNPGKIVNAPPMTENLRFGPKYAPVAINTKLNFDREGGFVRALEMCNGAAVCRKTHSGTMCPSYMATRDEKDTTRGRANALRNALAGNLLNSDDFTSEEVKSVMDLCISCKACKTECPSSVDMAKIKTEFMAQYYDKNRVPVRTRLMSNIHSLAKLASPMAPLANLMIASRISGPVMSAVGVHRNRKMSPFVARHFVHRFHSWRKVNPVAPVTRGKVVYFHDTFATYNYPEIGLAAVKLIEAAGFEVILEERRVCCGRPALSKGLVEHARKSARRNVSLLADYARKGIPVVGTEPSCILTMRDEYLDLLPDDEDAQMLAAHSFMLDEWLAKLESENDLGIPWKDSTGPEVLFHGHCHQKSLVGIEPSMSMLRASGCRPTDSSAGCCGMAGSFGYEEEHYEISRLIGEERLFPTIRETPMDVIVSTTGVSCHQQIEHFEDRLSKHIVEVLADRVDTTRSWRPKVTEFGDSRHMKADA